MKLGSMLRILGSVVVIVGLATASVVGQVVGKKTANLEGAVDRVSQDLAATAERINREGRRKIGPQTWIVGAEAGPGAQLTYIQQLDAIKLNGSNNKAAAELLNDPKGVEAQRSEVCSKLLILLNKGAVFHYRFVDSAMKEIGTMTFARRNCA